MTTIILATVEVIIDRDRPASFSTLRRIIVPLDRSGLARAALVPAMTLARRTGARLELLTTKVPDGPVTATSFLDELADTLGDLDVATLTTEERDPVLAVASRARDGTGSTLIVMSSHGRGGVRRAALGSVAEGIVASGAAPVVVVGPAFESEAYDPEGPVLVAHDGLHEPDLGAIADLARTTGGRVHLLEVVSPPTLAPLRAAAEATPAPKVGDTAEALQAMGMAVTTEAVSDRHAGEAILARAAQLGAGYVAATSRANTGPRRVALGSVASQLVRSSAVPVLITRPPRPDDAPDTSEP